MIAAVVLAAGNARRFDGTQKLLAPVQYEGATLPLVRLTVAGLVSAGVDRIVIVGGRDAELVRLALDGLDVEFAVNPDYASGMSSSLRVGVAAAVGRWSDAESLLIALGDQPLAGTGVVESLVKARVASGPGDADPQIVAPRFQGELGTPVLFARILVPELLAVAGDRGAKGVVKRKPARVRYVDFDRPAPLDVDTVSDLTAFRASLSNH
jgi:molybdenum cofactor cytidylyltransferase